MDYSAFSRSQHASHADRPTSLVSIASTSSDYSISLPTAFLHNAAFSPPPTSTGFPFPEASLPSDRFSRNSNDDFNPAPALNPRHALMRLRRVSMPANVSQSNHHASPSYSSKGKNRMSVASLTSVGSFESLPEEDVLGSVEKQQSIDQPPVEAARPPLANINTSGNRPKPLLAHRATTPAKLPTKTNVRRVPTSRATIPAPIPHGATYQPFVIPKSTFGPRSPLSRPTSISNSTLREDDLREEIMGQRLGGDGKRERVRTKSSAGGTNEETMRREDRRWRIALELRDTERVYWGVLEEIDTYYYQPLLAALPPSPYPSRRASRNSSPSSPVIAPFSPPFSPMLGPLKRMSTYIPSSPLSFPVDVPSGQILSRKEVTEIFSNFPDVLNLAMVMASSLDSAIPDRPSDSVPVSPILTTAQLFPLSSFNTSPELSSSSDTLESDGPATPGDPKRKKPSEMDTMSEYTPKPRGITAPPLSLGKMLIPILPFLKSYSFFISNFASALSRLASLETVSAPPSPSMSASSPESRSKWQGFADERRKLGVGRGLGLGALLLNIVQRIPRYRLLLADLVKYTEPDHVDYRELQTAFQVVDNVANFLEVEIQAHVNVLRILELQRSLINLDAPLLVPGRRFLRSSALRKLDRRGNSQTRTFYLFNDIIIYAAEAEAGWGIGRGLGFADVADAKAPPKQHRPGGGFGSGSWESLAGGVAAGVQMRMIRRFGLCDVTVVGAEDCGVPGKRFGFEILTSEKSFAVYADSREEKESWLEAIRDAKSDLLRDRLTLLKDGESTMRRTHRERQTSMLIAPSTLRPAFATPPPNPRFDFIPPTPSDEIEALVLDLPAAILPVPALPSVAFEPPPSPSRPSLRTRRWSDMTPEAAAQAIADSPSPSKVIDEVVEVRVIENYNAPLWIPDNKVSRCMRCAGHFSVWRRRHHCRLCGAVVCWACSSKTFIIPSDEVGTPNRLARSCDECYETVFSPADVGLVVESAVESPSQSTAPDFYLDSLESPAAIKEETSRGRLRDSLASLLGRRN